MDKISIKKILKRSFFLLLLHVISSNSFAQYLRTSYFMENATNRLQLNPAFQPTRGYIAIPVIGSFQASASSNALGVSDVTDIINSKEDFWDNDKFFDRLKTDNRVNVNLNTNIVSLGFYRGKSFWSANIGVRADVNASIPRTMFDYLREVNNSEPIDLLGKDFSINNQQMNATVYTEIGLGYSREIIHRLTIGGRMKMLLGSANINMDMRDLKIEENLTSGTIISHGTLNVSMPGTAVETKTDDNGTEYVNKVKYDKAGVAGYGMAVDFGATYQLLNNLKLSASIVDLGFISWSKNSTTTAVANQERTIEYKGYGTASDGDVLDMKYMGYAIQSPKSKTTSIASTLVLGGEYTFFQNQLGLGVLSTTHFSEPKTISEFTFSANYCPKSWFNVALSYSTMQNNRQTFGLGLKLGPVFVGTDYMFLGNSSKTKDVNAYLSITLPLGKSRAASRSN
ncbi:DUF5723 family protein [uncultured Bacteroides sp.]|uniref:DUF5723 family protein n=1 Tax=uncultured Bacteroides sp. TaxID=162156 RepID=UPI002AA688EA|nr:DUF5723 family protein [uncultured Bacteroides sp.]